MKTATSYGGRALSLLLALLMTFSLFSVGASASTIEDGSRTASMTLGPGHFFLKTTAGTSLGAWGYTYTTNDGLTGPAYCVNHGLHFTSRTLPIEGKYTSSPKTAGVFANGYPQHSIDTFLGLYLSANPILSGLTEDEYAYATQLAIWATLGQLGIEGTPFTSGREQITQPTGDTQQMRVFRVVQLLLNVANSWTFVPQTGMYIRTDENTLGGNISVPADMTLEHAADQESYGFKREFINGTAYFTHEYIFASATSTYYDGYNIELWADGAPSGYIFTDMNNVELQHGHFREIQTWTLPTERKSTSLNSNGSEYVGKAKLCIPASTVPNSGEITINCASYVMQYNIYLAKNEDNTQQSYIIADPSKAELTADAVLKWGGILTETGDLEVMKVDGSGNPLPGAVFTLAGSDGSTRTGTSGSDGRVVWDQLDPNFTYTLTEMTPPAGYGIADPITLNIKAARTNYVTVRDTVSKQLTVRKIDKQTGYSLMGAVIAFEQIDGDFYTTRTTDHAGMIQLDADQLPIGSYKVYEITAPEGYELDSTVQTVNWNGLRDVTLTFNDVRKPTLIIYKCDAGNNYSLPYATFEVYKNGQLVTTVTTNQNGLAYVSDVTTGYYTVKETVAPAGYLLNTKEYSVYVDNYNPATTDDPRIVIEDKALPMLRIVKYDGQTMKRLPDTTFAVYHDTELIGEYTTDANGEVLLYDLDPGTYLIQEIAAPNSHVVNSTPQEIKLEAGTTDYAVIFLNYLKPGIHLIKLDSQSMKPLPNARYRITQVGGGYSKEFITDINGEIDLTALDPGSYVVEELAAPDGYLIDDARRTIKIEAGENAQFVFTDTKKPSLTVLKYDSERKQLLSGATFRVAKIEDGSNYLDRVTDTDGQFTIENLDPGVYSVQEVKAPTGYVLNDHEYHVELFAGQNSQLVVTDEKKPDLKIVKKDADTGAYLSGASFRINKADGSTLTTVETGENGEVLLTAMDPGVYQITEVTPPVGYLPAEQPTQLITLYPNKLGTAIFENHAKPSLTINKIDSITKDPIKSVSFRIVYASNQTFTGEINDLGKFTTDANGQIKLDMVKDGWYRVTELEPAKGYAIKGSATQDCYIEGGKPEVLTFENTPLSAIIIKKTSNDGKPLQGAWFRLRYLGGSTSGTGGTTIGEYETSSNGTIVVTDLKAGTYVAEEITAPQGYVLGDDNIKTVYLSGEQQDVITISFGNAAKSSVLIKKISSSDHKPLSDVDFLVTYSDGAVVGNGNGHFTTDSTGCILIDDLDPDVTIIAKELRAKDGYVLDDVPQSIKTKSGETVTMEFRNAPKGRLTIVKKSTTGEYLSGAEFRVTTSDGKFVANAGGKVSSNGFYVSDENGMVVLTNLEPNTYVVTETKAPDGYVIGTQPITVAVTADDAQTVTFSNPEKGSLTIYKKSTNGEPLSGAEFRVTTADGKLVANNGGRVSSNGIYVTDENGMIVLTKLEPNTYVVTETKAPAGHVLASSPQTVVVTADEAQTVSFTDGVKGSLTIVKKDAATGAFLKNAEFKVTTADGKVVGNDEGRVTSNGFYTTDSNGQINITGLEPNTYIVTETKAPDGYVKDETPVSVVVDADDHQTVVVTNAKKGSLVILKKDSVSGKPLEGVTFRVTTSKGTFVASQGGKVSSNGIYKTDKNGQITISDLAPDTYVVTELETIPGYIIDENTRSQTVALDTNDTQTLTFYNIPAGGLLVVKVDQDDGSRLKGAKMEIRKMNGEIIGTYTTDANGVINLPEADSGWYIVTELKAPKGYKLDSTPHQVEVKDGQTGRIEVENEKISGISIHKTDSVSGEGIYGVTFVIYDSGMNPVEQIVTDQYGYAYTETELSAGKYFIRELEAAEGYLADTQYKTIFVVAGKVATVEWKNTPVTGQIQITKYASDANTITGQASGETLKGAVFEIVRERSGAVVGYITTDARGVAASSPLPLGRYIIREVSSPAYYQVSSEKFDVTLEYPGQIIKLSAYDKPAKLSVTINKTGVKEVLAGSKMTYNFTIANGSNVPLENFFWHDKLPYDITAASGLTTGTYNTRLTYRILYKTNYNDYRVLASNLLSTNNYGFQLNALPLQSGEVVTDVYFDFGTVPAGFQSTVKPTLTVSVSPTATNGYYVTNRADAGGKFGGTWETNNTSWLTIVRNLTPVKTTPLPKTGY